MLPLPAHSAAHATAATLPRAHALRIARARGSSRNLWHGQSVPLTEPSNRRPKNPYMRVPETPPDLPLDCPHSGGVLVGESTR